MRSVVFQLAVAPFVHFGAIHFAKLAVPVNVLVQYGTLVIVQSPFLVFGPALVLPFFLEDAVGMP